MALGAEGALGAARRFTIAVFDGIRPRTTLALTSPGSADTDHIHPTEPIFFSLTFRSWTRRNALVGPVRGAVALGVLLARAMIAPPLGLPDHRYAPRDTPERP